MPVIVETDADTILVGRIRGNFVPQPALEKNDFARLGFEVYELAIM